MSFHYKTMSTFDFGPKEWIHHTGFPINTPEGMRNVIKLGYKGIECDVFYSEEEDRFIVAHDLPYKGQKVYLDDLLDILKGTDVKLWIDFKNASLVNLFKEIKKFKEIDQKLNVNGHYFVESPDMIHQILLSRFHVNSISWLRLHSLSRAFYLRNLPNKLGIVLGDFQSISFPIEHYNEKVESTYGHVSKLIFTVNDPKIIKKLKNDSTVKVILKDL